MFNNLFSRSETYLPMDRMSAEIPSGRGSIAERISRSAHNGVFNHLACIKQHGETLEIGENALANAPSLRSAHQFEDRSVLLIHDGKESYMTTLRGNDAHKWVKNNCVNSRTSVKSGRKDRDSFDM